MIRTFDAVLNCRSIRAGDRVAVARRHRRQRVARLRRRPSAAPRRPWRFALAAVSIGVGLLAVFQPGQSADAMEAPSTTYRVASGDTLFGIARQTGVSVADLARANNLSNPDLIFAGQTLQLIGAEPPVARTYVVQAGDTLSGIADAHG